MTDLADRYGTSRRGLRPAVVVAGVLGAVFLAWLAWSAWSFSTPEVRSELVGYEVVSEHEATAKVDIRISDPEVRGACTVRAFAADHTVVGELPFAVPGPDDVDRDGGLMEISIRTERRATSVGELGCTTPDQVRPR
ncbi:conserved hypothetical protein [metagenome]|uniref:DUF4307 domain-containing protein n=1 Tax=metagenome TaxID=256318 RepID=A0A2P2BZG3_9ZZZZ